jgi:hypothetical protein
LDSALRPLYNRISRLEFDLHALILEDYDG